MVVEEDGEAEAASWEEGYEKLAIVGEWIFVVEDEENEAVVRCWIG